MHIEQGYIYQICRNPEVNEDFMLIVSYSWTIDSLDASL